MAAHGPFIHLLTQQERNTTAKLSAVSFPCTSQGYSPVAPASGMNRLITSQRGPGLSRVGLACPCRCLGSSPARLRGPGLQEGRNGSNALSLVSLRFSPSAREHVRAAPQSSFPLSIRLWRPDAVLGDTWSEPGKIVLHVGPSLSGTPGNL